MTKQQLVVIALVVLAGMSWLQFAERPSARTLRRAIADTLPSP